MLRLAERVQHKIFIGFVHYVKLATQLILTCSTERKVKEIRFPIRALVVVIRLKCSHLHFYCCSYHSVKSRAVYRKNGVCKCSFLRL